MFLVSIATISHQHGDALANMDHYSFTTRSHSVKSAWSCTITYTLVYTGAQACKSEICCKYKNATNSTQPIYLIVSPAANNCRADPTKICYRTDTNKKMFTAELVRTGTSTGPFSSVHWLIFSIYILIIGLVVGHWPFLIIGIVQYKHWSCMLVDVNEWLKLRKLRTLLLRRLLARIKSYLTVWAGCDAIDRTTSWSVHRRTLGIFSRLIRENSDKLP